MEQSSPQGVVIVTGAARRIGAATARVLHAAGWKVVIHYRASGAEARQLQKELDAVRPDAAVCLRANLRDLGALEQLVAQAHECWGRLDALVNNASSYFPTPIEQVSEADFDELIGTNLKAPLFLARACAMRMDGGAIVNIADIHASQPMKHYSVYCAAKAGLVSLTESLARELAPRIRVNAIAPGHILWADGNAMTDAERNTEISRVPMQRLGQPEEVGMAAAYLLSPAAAYVTGAVLPVDGGLRLS